MVAKVSADYRQKEAMAYLMAAQGSYDATHGNNSNNNNFTNNDYGIYGKGALGKQIVNSLSQKGLQTLASTVKDLLLKGGPKTSLPADAAKDLAEEGSNAAETAGVTSKFLQTMDAMFQTLSRQGVNNEVIQALKDEFMQQLEEGKQKAEEKGTAVRKNNEKIKTNKQEGDEARTELESLMAEDGQFTLPGEKFILGSEGYRNSSFTMNKPSSTISGVGSSDKKERTKRERKSRSETPKAETNNTDKKQRIKRCQDKIRKSDTAVAEAKAENSSNAVDIEQILREREATAEGGEDLLNKAAAQQTDVAAAQSKFSNDFSAQGQANQNVAVKSANNAAESTEDMTDSVLETVQGDALLVSGIPLIPIPATTAIGVEAEAKGGAKTAIGAASLAPSSMAMAAEFINMVQQGANMAQIIVGMGTMAASASEQSSFLTSALEDGASGTEENAKLTQDTEALLVEAQNGEGEEELPEEPKAA